MVRSLADRTFQLSAALLQRLHGALEIRFKPGRPAPEVGYLRVLRERPTRQRVRHRADVVPKEANE